MGLSCSLSFFVKSWQTTFKLVNWAVIYNVRHGLSVTTDAQWIVSIILHWRPHDCSLSRFDTIPACDRHTVRRTDAIYLCSLKFGPDNDWWSWWKMIIRSK